MRNSLVPILLASVMIASAAIAQTITVGGSDSLLGLSRKWAESYQTKRPGTAIQVSGGGAAAAFGALAEKKLDLVLAARSMRYPEAEACVAALGQRPAEHKVAVSGLAVYVNAKNPVKVLTYDEVFGIYRGKHTNWKALGGEEMPISVYSQDTNSVYGELFNEEVLNGKGIAGGVRLLTEVEMLKTIAADAKAIGFGALQTTEGTQPLSIKRAFSSTPVDPTADAIANRIYPISRFVFCYANPKADQAALKAYLDWIRSEEGQQIAKDAGFYPLPAKWRPSQ